MLRRVTVLVYVKATSASIDRDTGPIKLRPFRQRLREGLHNPHAWKEFMALRLKRLMDDITYSWTSMPKSQALRWYGSILRHAPTVWKQKKFYSADRDMVGDIRFRMFGKEFSVDTEVLSQRAGNPPYSFYRELFVRQIYFRAFQHVDFTTTLDLGCNVGVVTSVMKQLGGPDSRAVGVDARVYEDNAFRTKMEQTPGVTILKGVLCGESIRNDPAALSAMCDPYKLDAATATTVLEVMDRCDLEHVDFLKMDIEGAEFAIFRDSAEWLKRVDNFAMEVHNYIGDPTEIVKRFEESGFQVKWSDENGDPVESRLACYIYASKIGSLKG
jgi:FkbM family methyltransferase